MIKMVNLNREIELYKSELIPAINTSLEHAYFIMGPHVETFEKNAAEYLSVSFATGVASGTDALFLALKAAGIGQNDEVITTPFTFIATAEAIIYCGATPVFADVEQSTMNIDTNDIIKKITKKTKAIIAVHLFGNPCNMRELKKIADEHNILLIEDAAQAFGALALAKKIGTIGTIGCFSFFPTKNLGCYGDGGLVVTNNEEIYRKIKILQNHGSSKKYYHEVIGYNSRLDDIQAAILNVKLRYVEKHNNIRRNIAHLYMEKLQNYVSFQHEYKDCKHVYHQFTIRSSKRDKLQQFLQEKGIETSIYYPIPLHLQNSLKSYCTKDSNLINAEILSKEVLSIPIHPYLTHEEITTIIEQILNFYRYEVS